MNPWQIAGLIIATVSPTLTIIGFGSSILIKLTRLETDMVSKTERIEKIEKFSEKCKSGEAHKRPMQVCFDVFATKPNN